jgi:hypothetical protein
MYVLRSMTHQGTARYLVWETGTKEQCEYARNRIPRVLPFLSDEFEIVTLDEHNGTCLSSRC